MKRLTTPKLTFELPSTLIKENIQLLSVTFLQNKKILFVKYKNDFAWENNNTISIKFSQKDTKKFLPGILQMEIHVVTTGGDSLISEPISCSVKDVLNDEVLE